MAESLTLMKVPTPQVIPQEDIIDSIYNMVDQPAHLQKLLLGLIRCMDFSDSEVSTPDEEIRKIKQLSDQLLPHFRRAIEMQMTLHAHSDLASVCSDVINLVEVPVALVDAQGIVVKTNSTLYKKGKRLKWLNAKRGAHFLAHSDQQQKLRDALQAIERSAEFKRMRIDLDVEGMWFATCISDQAENYYLLTWNEQSTQEQVIANARERFALTKREAEVLRVLMDGLSAKEVAQQLYISSNTVKNHINNIFQKTGTRKQQELIRRVYCSYFPATSAELNRKIILQKDDHDFQLSDGRNLSYQDVGDKNLPVVIYFHSFCGSRKEIPLEFFPSSKEEFRWISVDRPGFGRSTQRKNRNFLDFAHDIEELLHHLRIDNVTVLGYSLGTVYAMAYEREYAHRVAQMYLVSPSPNVEIVLNSKTTGVIKSYFRVVNYLPKITGHLVSLFNRMTPEECMKTMLFGKVQLFEVPKSDRDFLKEPSIYSFSLNNMREVMRQGSKGWGGDAVNLALPWGFEIKAPSVPTKMIQGSIDTVVSLEMSQTLAHRMNVVDFEIYHNETHMLIFRHLDSIVSQMKQGYESLTAKDSLEFAFPKRLARIS